MDPINPQSQPLNPTVDGAVQQTLDRPTDLYVCGVRYQAPMAVVMHIGELERALRKVQEALDELHKVER